MNDMLLEQELPPDHRSGFVAVVGRPNVGKSTLVNSYVGQKVAIVSRKPQTTRNRILGILTQSDAQIIFVDTPGIHRPLHKLGEYMVQTARKAIPDADVLLFMVDVGVSPREADRIVARVLAKDCRSPIILVLNKMDLLEPDRVQQITEEYLSLGTFDDWMMVSASRGDNLEDLLAKTTARLPLGPRYYPEGQVTDAPERFIAAELIREQVLHFLHQEVPHAIAVVVEQFTQRKSGVTYISATVYVEKASQKGIVIGAGGKMLKQIGTSARHEIQRMLNTKVFVELWVKVRLKWRRDDAALRRVGYNL